MGWYDSLYGRPGHGVSPDAPRKKGIARFAEMTARDFPQLLGCNALCCLLMLVPALLISMGVILESFWMALLFGILSGFAAGPAILLLTVCVLRSLRDDPQPFLSLAGEVLRKNLRRCFALGALTMGIGTAMAFVTNYLFAVAAAENYYPGFGVLLVLILDYILFAVVFTMAWVQMPLSGDSCILLIKNGLKLTVSAPKRCIGGCFLVMLWVLAIIALFPVSIFLVVLIGFWLTGLIAGMLFYPVLEKEYSLKSHRAAPRTAQTASDGEKTHRAADWWHYHWGIVLTCALIVLGVWYVAYTMLTEVDPDYSVAVVTAQALPDEAVSSLETALAGLADDANGDGKVVVAVNNYTWSLSPDAAEMDMQMAGSARMISDMNSGDSSIWILEDADGFEESFTAISERYGDGWRTHTTRWADMPALTELPLSTYSERLDADTATPVQSLFSADDVVLLGDSSTLWQAISRDVPAADATPATQ